LQTVDYFIQLFILCETESMMYVKFMIFLQRQLIRESTLTSEFALLWVSPSSDDRRVYWAIAAQVKCTHRLTEVNRW